MKPLRFAPIIRVSSEKQKDKGQSLELQTNQIEGYVQSLGGVIPESCTKYTGQEHATVDEERKLLDQLLEDSAKDQFDAVIVCDISRWGRDNLKSKEGLKILRANGVRFYLAMMELNLYNPDHTYMLGSQMEMAEYMGMLQSLKSMNAKILIASKGHPASGKKPYGRIWRKEDINNGQNGWSIDPKKKRIIERCAERYLSGEPIKDIASSSGINVVTLSDILWRSTGTRWTQRFNSDRLNIHEAFETEIPALLDARTRELIDLRKEANKTYYGVKKNYYLLSKFIRCAHCGYTLSGANMKGHNYYHHTSKILSLGDCKHTRCLPCEELETAVLLQLFDTFGDMKKIREAIEQAIPDIGMKRELAEERDEIRETLTKIDRQVQRLVKAVMEDSMTSEDVKKQRKELEQQEIMAKERLSVIESQLVDIPDPEQVKKQSALACKVIADVRSRPSTLLRKPYELKRKFIEHCFIGKDNQGKPLGVYVTLTEDKKYSIEVRGLLGSAVMGWEKIQKTVEDYIPTKDENSLYYQNNIVFSINIPQTTAGNQAIQETA